MRPAKGASLGNALWRPSYAQTALGSADKQDLAEKQQGKRTGVARARGKFEHPGQDMLLVTRALRRLRSRALISTAHLETQNVRRESQNHRERERERERVRERQREIVARRAGGC